MDYFMDHYWLPHLLTRMQSFRYSYGFLIAANYNIHNS